MQAGRCDIAARSEVVLIAVLSEMVMGIVIWSEMVLIEVRSEMVLRHASGGAWASWR